MVTVFETITTELDEHGVLLCTLNRPSQRNALTMQSLHDLASLWELVEADERVRAVVLTGSGEAFCAGGDVAGMASDDFDIAAISLGPLTARVWRGLAEVSKPIIAAVNGDAVGAGLFHAALCDFVIASESARFGDPHVRIGLVASGGGILVSSIGVHHTKELLLSGTLVSAGRAREMGLVTATCPAGEELAAAQARAEQLAGLPADALRWTKRCLGHQVRQAWSLTWDAELAFEALSAARPAHRAAAESFRARST